MKRGLGGVVALLAAPLSAQAPGTPPVFGVKVESVYVDAFATHRGQSVSGLTAANFELTDNGVRQRVELVAADTLPLLAVLAFDTSASVAGEKLRALRSAGLAFLESLRAQDEVALLTFCEEIQWTPPTRDRAAVRRALERLTARGGTSVFDGLHASLTLPETQARILVVLFSDGEDNLSWLGDGQVRRLAERSNALIHVVGTRAPSEAARRRHPSPETDHVRTLRQIAEATGGRFWEAEDPSRIREAFAAVAQAMNERYVLRYEPQGVPREGWHRIDLKLKGRSGRVQARRGYWLGRG